MARCVLFLLLSAHVLSIAWSQSDTTADICTKTIVVPKLAVRDSNYRIIKHEQPLNDRFLKEGWYQTNGKILLRSPPGFKRCGTLYPIWRYSIGLNSTMCIQTHSTTCHAKFEIETAKCDTKEIFKLKRSPFHDSAYCFVDAWTLEKTPPIFNETPYVNFSLVTESNRGSALEYRCEFKKHTNERMLYTTYWYVNNRNIRTEVPRRWNNGDVINIHKLTEGKLRTSGIYKVGFLIKCSVRVSEGSKSPWSLPVASDEKYIGIKVHEKTIALKTAESADISLQLTAPFGCVNLEEDCSLRIEINHIGSDNRLMRSTCGAKVPQSTWNHTVTLSVQGQMTPTIENQRRILKLKLKTEPFLSHPFWGNYDLDLITVQLTTNTTALQFKICSARSDPHMTTFDGRRYEHHHEGVFTLYKHNDLPVEIQMKTARCAQGNTAWCNCGIAVRAGMAVYEKNICVYEEHFTHTQCADDGDLLRVLRSGDKEYKIHLPTGGYLHVIEDKFLELTMYPSIKDTGKSSGLCGILSCDRKDAFFLRNGTYSNNTTAFSKSWGVNERDSLFNHETLGNLTNWQNEFPYCRCNETEEKTALNPSVICSAMEFPALIDRGYKVIENTCDPDSPQETKPPPTTPTADISKPSRRIRRQSDSAWREGWSVEKARAFCVDLFKKSRSIQVCENVTSLEITESIAICVLDIQLTGTTDFAMSAINNVREKCLHEVAVNPVYWEKEKTTFVNQSIFDIVVAGACLNDCSGNGHCVQGVCVCESVYGGSDCSVDLTFPPTITHVENDGVCDKARDECVDISIYGKTFAEGQTKCLVEEIKVTDTKSEMVTSKSGTASFESIGQVRCTIESSDDTDSDDVEYVRAFRISISNNGANYSTRVGVMVHDGTCVHPTVDGPYFKWSIEGPYCLYKGICVRHLEEQPGKECKVCDVFNNTRIWKDSTDSKCQSETHFPFAIVASCAALLVAITAVVVVMCVVRRFTRNRNLANRTPVRFSPTKMK